MAPSENEFDTPDLHYAAERQKELLHFVTAWVELESILTVARWEGRCGGMGEEVRALRSTNR